MCCESAVNRNTFFLRGTRILDWYTVAGLHLLSSRALIGPEKRFIKMGKGVTYSSSASGLLRSRENPDHSTLLHNLAKYGTSECTVARDKVYGPLSISIDAEELGIKLDYSAQKTVHEVFMDASFALFKMYSVNVLIMAEIYQSSQDMWESWLPDWTSSRSKYAHPNWAASALSLPPTTSCWSLNSPTSFPISFEHQTSVGRTACTLFGFIFDQVEAITPAMRLIYPRISTNTAEGFAEAVAFARNYHFDDDAIGTTLMLARFRLGFSIMLEFKKFGLGILLRASEHPEGDKSLSVDALKLVNRFRSSVGFAENLRLCVTRCNQLALCNENTQPGDLLACLDGYTDDPFVLRPLGDGYYKFVGRANHPVVVRGRVMVGPFSIQEFSLV
jgi:hypothetical protein